jgi:ABC-type transport system substrate-binding protein
MLGTLSFVLGGLCLMLTIPAGARTRPHYGGTVRVEVEGDPLQRPNGLARRLVLDGLTGADSDGMPRPGLAIEWKSDNNDHRWQFRLRTGVHFHDGTPLTSVNVAASLISICGSGCPWSAVRAVGSSVVFTADYAMPNLPYLLAGDEYLIALTTAADGTTPAGLIGTGPLQLAPSPGGPVTLTANETCWQGRPFADNIEITGHKSIRDQWLDLGVGRADLVEVPPEQLRQAHEQRLTVIASPPVTLLALEARDSGALANPMLREAVALAVDRSALSNVIFQKQGEITASLLPAALTGYAFLFPADRDLNKSHEVRGGLAAPTLTLASEAGAAMQLAAQRIALNLHEAGFNVQVIAAGGPRPDLTLRRLTLETGYPQAALESLLRGAGYPVVVAGQSASGAFEAEREFLANRTLIPLLYLPRAWAVGGRVRDLRLGAGGEPDLADVSLEDAP